MKIRTRAHAIVASALALAGLGALGARAVASPEELDPLQALDRALPRAAQRAQGSVVAIECERDDRERPLTQREKMALGLGAGRSFDPRYYSRPAGASSGVIVRAKKGERALVATAWWNVQNSKTISVVLADGSRLPATLQGHDENLDVAVLSLEANEALKPIEVAQAPRIGQYAILVGRGGDHLSPVVTVGNVSALGRFKGDSVQVTARMNYGNTGGAVVDLDGRLLGIAARLTDRTHQGINSGVGFAAPVDRLVKELDELAQGKVVAKRKSPFLGVGAPIGPNGVPLVNGKLPEGVKSGVVIGSIVKGKAAERTGLLAGDVIEIFNGVEVKDFTQLRDEIERLEVGEKVIVTIYRPEKGERDFTIELGFRDGGDE